MTHKLDAEHPDFFEKDSYRHIIDTELVNLHIGISSGDARADLNKIIDWHIAVSKDPAVNNSTLPKLLSIGYIGSVAATGDDEFKITLHYKDATSGEAAYTAITDMIDAEISKGNIKLSALLTEYKISIKKGTLIMHDFASFHWPECKSKVSDIAMKFDAIVIGNDIKLTADGFGRLHNGKYGSGPIYISIN